jgi:ribosomal protein S6
MSKTYELLVVLNATVTEAEETKLVELIKKTVKDGSIKKSDDLGKKAFAYPIAKQREGKYVLHTISCDAVAIVTLRKVLAAESVILRFVILTVEERKKVTNVTKVKKIEKKK